ncbi:recombinase family protein [Marivita geojedonensis]|uniref:Resolvase n=1 Tax=Marivita geojedonensis TaxID=1123756 RepID=A0A1X4NM13_9RHOB|nr:recombinase family protein [Marivita geojedonensis]OSQ51371.1 resolvase [Marivita geojedonensis]PRY77971.1 DNA invertase Pin-like site-specific DNA recombinase [Marivita geojedonensis]
MNKPRIRCAIYTRKSSDEGLDQDFNSLDAQAEACAAYIASQRHEGWVAGKTRYDDGGISGGTLDRPALQRLLTDIDAGLVQMVVVYKIDRLTRSLADFAKLVERFDAAGCSFVSVTQAFNTASSMGRLTLNVLLSFAQFEREVTAERIRDKIAASKKKGLWMGGVPPLGYDPHPDPKTRGLVINADEAETVRTIFALYDDLGCLNAVMRRANALGLRSKLHRFRSGRVQGGNPFSRGQIYALLRNPIYIGKIRHKAQIWDGQHEPIVDEALWDRVQSKLQAASVRPRGWKTAARQLVATPVAPLTGKLRDETGDRLTPTHTRRHGRYIRYYVSNRLISGGTDPRGWRLPAPALEQAVANAISRHIGKLAHDHRICARPDMQRGDAILAKAQRLVSRLSEGAPGHLQKILDDGQITKNGIVLRLNVDGLAEALGVQPNEIDHAVLAIKAPFELRRRGVEGKIIVGDREPQPDRTLVRALSQAHAWSTDLRNGKPLGEIAAATQHSESYIRTRAQLAFLAPAIQGAILEGRQPADLTLERIIRKPVPLDWDAQARMYGFAQSPRHP